MSLLINLKRALLYFLNDHRDEECRSLGRKWSLVGARKKRREKTETTAKTNKQAKKITERKKIGMHRRRNT